MTSLALAAAAAPLTEASARDMRGPITGQRVEMREPVQGKRAPLRGPVEVKRAPQRQPVFSGNTYSQTYNSQSRHSYTRTGTELFNVNSRGFNYYQKNQQWNPNTRWRLYQYDDTVHTNLYRIDR